ncbi:MAG: hypothetical protein PHD37_00645 [Gallionellaceae bacterium]|nr:hypothetical protein [Gallionellaceae bacterium]
MVLILDEPLAQWRYNGRDGGDFSFGSWIVLVVEMVAVFLVARRLRYGGM